MYNSIHVFYPGSVLSHLIFSNLINLHYTQSLTRHILVPNLDFIRKRILCLFGIYLLNLHSKIFLFFRFEDLNTASVFRLWYVCLRMVIHIMVTFYEMHIILESSFLIMIHIFVTY